MREGIGEYRGKRIDTQKWVEGNYVHLRGCKEHEDLHLIIDEHGEYHRIDHDTLCEYTGLKDKNGKKIYENDIARNPCSMFNNKVEWDNHETGYVLRSCNCRSWDFDSWFAEQLEVIGNAFDNLELIQGVKE